MCTYLRNVGTMFTGCCVGTTIPLRTWQHHNLILISRNIGSKFLRESDWRYNRKRQTRVATSSSGQQLPALWEIGATIKSPAFVLSLRGNSQDHGDTTLRTIRHVGRFFDRGLFRGHGLGSPTTRSASALAGAVFFSYPPILLKPGPRCG